MVVKRTVLKGLRSEDLSILSTSAFVAEIAKSFTAAACKGRRAPDQRGDREAGRPIRLAALGPVSRVRISLMKNTCGKKSKEPQLLSVLALAFRDTQIRFYQPRPLRPNSQTRPPPLGRGVLFS